MKEQVKGILFDFKDAGWSVQKVEKELGFSNGTLGKVVNGKSGISEFRFTKLWELHQKEIKKPPAVTKELATQIAGNSLPEKKARIEKEMNPAEPKENTMAFFRKHGCMTWDEKT